MRGGGPERKEEFFSRFSAVSIDFDPKIEFQRKIRPGSRVRRQRAGVSEGGREGFLEEAGGKCF